MELRQLELDLWRSLETATQFPDTANLRSLCDALEQEIEDRPTSTQLKVAAEVLMQLSEVHAAKANSMLDQWQHRHNPQEPIVDLENCVDLFVQSLQLDVDDLMENQEPVQYPSNRRSRNQTEGSVVGVLDRDQLLAALDEQMEQHPGITEEEAFNQAIEVAHGEDIAAWVEAITLFLKHHSGKAVPLLELAEKVQYPRTRHKDEQGSVLVKTWLTLLLGGFLLEQRGEFYSPDIWVKNR